MPMAQGALVAGTLATILTGLVASVPDAPLGALLARPSAGNLAQIRAWNDAVETEPIERRVHDIIADRVREQPDAEAVCAWDGSFTYTALDTASARLAARLVQLGVGPEVLVPLCFEKSVCSSPLGHLGY